MLRISLIFFLLSIAASLSSAECPNDLLGARYKITKTDKQKTQQISHMTLWRNGLQVAHQYTDTQITEIWQRTSNEKIRLIKNFDTDKRGIEYQPDEINMRLDDDGWQKKKQLVTNALISSMKEGSSSHEGCERLTNYSKQKGHQLMQLKWLSEKKLVQYFSVTTATGTISWELAAIINDKKKVIDLFNSRSNYQMTDYADIGDNESDPFLVKMINLGFITHSASGIYDQHGNAIDNEHNH